MARPGVLIVVVLIAAGGLAWLVTRPRPAARPAPVRLEPRPAAPAASGPVGTASPAAPAGASLPQIDGIVRDALTGAPVASVDVLFTVVGGPEVTATSGADGRFATRLAPGRYRVRASGVRLHGFSPAELSVGAGAEIHGYEVRVARLATVEGRVVDGAGKPLAGVEVSFTSKSARGRVNAGDVEGGKGETDASGGFELTVAPGEVTLLAAVGTRRGRLALPYVEPGAIVQGAEILVEDDAPLAGVVRGPKGEAVAGAKILAVAQPGPGGLPGRAEATSGADGRFAIAGLAAGKVRIEARAKGYAPGSPIEAVAPADELVVQLREAATIRGRVLDPDGQPLDGVKLTARRGGSHLPWPEATSDAAGAFAIADLGPGPWDVVAEKSGFAATVRGGVPAPSEGLLLRLSAPGGLAGAVSTASGQPVNDFEIHWRPVALAEDAHGGGGRLHFFAPDGTYRVEGLAPGTYEVAVRATGHASQARRIAVSPGAFADGGFRLPDGATVFGRVRGADGQPLAGAKVEIMTGGADDLEVRTGADGDFELADIAPGRRSLSIEHPGFVSRSETGLELAAGEKRRVDLTLTPLTPGQGATFEFAGIGATLAVRGGETSIGGLVPGGPAERTGLAPGDVIESVGGIPCKDRSLADITEDIRGVAGTIVHLQMRRGTNRFSVDVVRGTVRYGG